ncbi:hypothetical protein [Shimia ponticola]|uniref:hypothetical protein n=1 Tax=Shimia ponticola TaxID=2582893 RepID=UPI0011BED76A|nr:hypothetical protein [Shimia ponticola]
MPQALAVISPALFGAGGTLALVSATSLTGLTFAGAIVSVGGSLLLSAATNALFAPDVPEQARPENIQANSKVSTAPRARHYGVVKVGGNVVFHRAREGKSYRVVIHGHGEISAVLERYLNNEPVSIDGDGFVTDSQYRHGGRSRVQLIERQGVVPETHYSEITDVWPEWTSAHRLDGLWSTLIIAESVPPEKYRAMYPKNEPDLAVLAETTKCADPRTGQTEFTENMALAISDYVASPDGFNRPDAFDPQDVAAQADICDREVALATGGTEKLYRISGSYLLNEKPQKVLARMLDACAGRMRLKPTGKVGLKVGAWVDPVFTLTYGDILEVQEVNSGPDILDRYNELPARFNSHDLGHIEVDAQSWQDASRVADDGEILPGPDKSLLMCPSHRQARQVMKIHTERDNPRQEVMILCKPRALPAIYEDTIALNAPELGLIGDYEVASHTLNFAKGLLRAVALTLRKIDAAAFSLALDEQGTVQELPEPDTPAGVPLPQNVTAAAAGIRTASNTFVAGIGVGWQAPPSDALTPLLKVSKTGENNFQDVSVGDDATSIVIPGLIDGQGYDISLAYVTPGGVVGDAVVITNVIAAAATDPPAAPTNLTVSDAGGGAALVEMIASISESLWKTEIYRDAVLVGVVYAGPGAEIAFIDSSGAGTFDWTARSVNVSNVNSNNDAGPVTAVIA